MKRKPQDKIDKEKINMLEPLNITLFGGPDDPCFGKHHDPQVHECNICGDAEICSIICAQKQSGIRAEIESSSDFKDIDTESIQSVKPFIVEDYLEKLFKKKTKLLFSYLLVKVSKRFKIETAKAKSAIFRIVEESPDYKRIISKGKKYIKK